MLKSICAKFHVIDIVLHRQAILLTNIYAAFLDSDYDLVFTILLPCKLITNLEKLVSL